MAALTTTELAKIRNICERRFAPVSYLKAQINSALQAIEDVMTVTPLPAGAVGLTVAQVVSAAIDQATTFSFTNAQKKILFALWSELKFQKDII